MNHSFSGLDEDSFIYVDTVFMMPLVSMFDTIRERRSTPFVFLVALSLFTFLTTYAFADSAIVPPAARLPFVLLSLGILIVGLLMASVHKGWWELTKVRKGVRIAGIALASFGAAFLVYSVTAPAPSASKNLQWTHTIEEATQLAAETNRPIMVDFRADWCVACGELDAHVFNAPEIAPELNRDFVLLKVDMDKETPENMKLADRFNVSGLPHVSFLSSDNKILKDLTFTGYLTVPQFKQYIDAAKNGTSVKSEDSFAKTMSEKGILAALALVFVAGLLSSLTPCVYPLIPVTIGILGAREAKSKLESFLVSIVYVLGIAVTYSTLGVAAATLGTVFGGAMQSPWVLGAIALIFLALGLSSVGLFDIRLPTKLQTKLAEKGGAGYLGAFVMGLFAGVIAAPCVGPIVAGVLVYVAQQQDIFLGVVLLFTFALGMGVLFIILGTFSGLISRLPRSGGWMEGVKIIVGTIFIGVAIYYASVLFPETRQLLDQLWLLVG